MKTTEKVVTANRSKPSVGGRRAGAGRKPGVPNKITTEFRATIQQLLDDNRDNVAKWLKQVAEGSPEVLDKAGKVVINARPPNPDAALQRLGHLAEFAAPKLSRAEVVGDGGGPLTVVINKLG